VEIPSRSFLNPSTSFFASSSFEFMSNFSSSFETEEERGNIGDGEEGEEIEDKREGRQGEGEGARDKAERRESEEKVVAEVDDSDSIVPLSLYFRKKERVMGECIHEEEEIVEDKISRRVKSSSLLVSLFLSFPSIARRSIAFLMGGYLKILSKSKN